MITASCFNTWPMKFDEKKLTVRKLADAFTSGSLISNREYQRGKAWETVQKQVFIDSLFRGYPVPTLFLYKIAKQGLEGESSTKYEIVDGQQRLRAVVAFLNGDFPLLNTNDKKFRIPESLRGPTPWGGRSYSELNDDTLRNQLDNLELNVQMISEVKSPDEIRDLFIRLQSGTPLTRQQVRDAWPGNVGPFIERVAGKLTTLPSCKLFGLIDGRGARSPDDEGDDPYANDRATAAQLLAVFLAREKSDRNFVGISAPELDGLYHEQASFDPQGAQAKLYQQTLALTETLLEIATTIARISDSASSSRTKKKYAKLTVLAVFCWSHDVLIAKENGRTNLTEAGMQALGKYIQQFQPMHSKGQTGQKIRDVYEQFTKGVPLKGVIDLDPKRDFSDDDKHQIRLAYNGVCARCNEPVLDGDEAFHHKQPWARGGRTVVENGLLLHKKCHTIVHEFDPVRVNASV
jgi:5-methylcytosine-specific restriction endonuclease McrA